MATASLFIRFARTILPSTAFKSPLYELPSMCHGLAVFRNHPETVTVSLRANHSPNPSKHAPQLSAFDFLLYKKYFRITRPFQILANASSTYTVPIIICLRKNDPTQPPSRGTKEKILEAVVQSQTVSGNVDGRSLKSKLFSIYNWFCSPSKVSMSGKEQKCKEKKKVKKEAKKKVKKGANICDKKKAKKGANICDKKKAKKSANICDKKKAKKSVSICDKMKEERQKKTGERKAFKGCGWEDDPCATSTEACDVKKKKCVPFCKRDKDKKDKDKKDKDKMKPKEKC